MYAHVIAYTIIIYTYALFIFFTGGIGRGNGLNNGRRPLFNIIINKCAEIAPVYFGIYLMCYNNRIYRIYRARS